ncbi:hypothetical protein [Roseicella aerolata]|uniref:Uncharacterized protein n=1 Tax=Roseicella aerolata TaxID=2883479 RepID=A0A9X1LDN1_9PROT|nr:hypothetical protein [Roseicella aerolata]MCB4825490.1 hypothetical protein [Roseicella aerolata]
MTMRSIVRFGAEVFTVDADTADRIAALRLTDAGAALALARRSHTPGAVPSGGAVRVGLTLTDAFSPELAAGMHAMSTHSNAMKKVRLADGQEVYADFRAADEIARLQRENQSLKGQNDALSAHLRGEVRIPAAQPVQATDAASLRLAARDAARAEEARRNDPSTPQGQYRQRLANAYRAGS